MPSPSSTSNPSQGPVSINTASMRYAGREHLSLALMDARNHTLGLMAQFEKATPDLNRMRELGDERLTQVPPPPLWLLGHVGWFQEWWVGRNTQRALGEGCPPTPTRLASIEPQADACFDPAQSTQLERWHIALPDLLAIKAYLMETLESTLELLEKADESDAALYFFRLALFYEDQMGEQLLVTAQALGIAIDLPLPAGRVAREAILMPSSRYPLGVDAGVGFAWDNERASHVVPVPEFEIDAQPTSWAQYVEFVDDGGYDEARHWSAKGWDWLQALARADGRRGPRFVEQIGVASGAVMQSRFGQTRRCAASQSAMHLSWYEADAYARWAGRRLPTEVEWELAASKARGMGFVWGDVWEWTATTLRPYPGFVAGPWASYSSTGFEHCKVLRGASFATRTRLHYPQFRGFALPHEDGGFFGFRTCAV